MTTLDSRESPPLLAPKWPAPDDVVRELVAELVRYREALAMIRVEPQRASSIAWGALAEPSLVALPW